MCEFVATKIAPAARWSHHKVKRRTNKQCNYMQHCVQQRPAESSSEQRRSE